MTRSPLLSIALALASAAAQATIPVDLEERSRAGLQHVCKDKEPDDVGDYIPCVEQVAGDDSEYTGSECVTAGLPPACTLDFVPKVRLKGKLLLFQDDQARDFSGTPRLATGLVLDVKARGLEARLVELFADADIGHWNSFAESFLVDAATQIQFTNPEKSAFNFASDNLVELGLALRQLAQDAYPTADLSGAIAVLTSVKREKPKRNLVHDDPADALASAARFRVVVEFVRLRP
jgi:hypothetical protein